MAKFGQGLIASLTRPSYLDSLGKTGMMIGQMPGQAMENRRERELMEQFANADPRQQAQLLKTKAIQSKDFGLLTQATKMETQLNQQETKFQGNNLLERLGNPQTTQVQADAIQQQLLADYRRAGMDDTQLRKAIGIANNKRLTGNAAERESIVNAHRVRAGEMVKAGNSYQDFAAIAGPNFQYLWDEAVDAQANKNQNDLKAEGQENITLIKGLMADETDPVKLAKLQQKLEDEAKRTGNFGPDIIGIDTRLMRAREEAAWKQTSNDETRRGQLQDKQAVSIARDMLNKDLIDIPEASYPDIQFDDILRSKINAEFIRQKDVKDKMAKARSERELPSEYVTKIKNIIKDRPEEFATGTALKVAYDVVIDKPNPKHPNYVKYVEQIMSAVNAHEKMQRNAQLSEDNLKTTVNKMIEQYVQMNKDHTWTFGKPDTLHELLTNTEEEYDGARQKFINNAVLYLKKMGGATNVTWRQLADNSMTGLTEYLSDEAYQRRQEDYGMLNRRAEELTSPEVAIKAIKAANTNMTDEEAKEAYEKYVASNRNRLVAPRSRAYVNVGSFNP